MAVGLSLTDGGPPTRAKGLQWSAASVNTEPISLQDAEVFASVFDPTGEESTLLKNLITGVRQLIEKRIRRLLVRREVTAYWREAPRQVRLPLPPHGSVQEVRRYVGTGETEVVPSGDWHTKGTGYLTLVVDKPLNHGVEVDFTAGYESLPAGLKIQMLRDIKTRFDQRDAVTGDAMNELPDPSAYDAWRVLS